MTENFRFRIAAGALASNPTPSTGDRQTPGFVARRIPARAMHRPV